MSRENLAHQTQEEIQQNQVLTQNQDDSLVFKKLVDENKLPAILCTTINKENPNHFAIIHANESFCKVFKQDSQAILGRSYDFLFNDVDVNYSSEDQLEYIRLVKAVKNHQTCSILKKLDNHLEEEHKISKFKIDFTPIKSQDSPKFYALFSFQKINDDAFDSDEIKNAQENIKSQNQTLVKNLERALSNEKLLREISYLIISDRPVKQIAQEVAASLCKLLKTERCIIHDLRGDKPNFIVEHFSSQNKPILSEENNEEIIQYINFQNSFYSKIRANSQKNSLYIAHNLKTDSAFEKMRGFYQKYNIDSQIFNFASFDNEINGGIYIFSAQNRDLTVDEMELIEIISDQLAIAIDRSYSIEKVMIANHNLLTKTLELKEAVKKEKEMRKMQTEFVALVSHEFKTPLQIIDSTREILMRKLKKLAPDDEAVNKYLERIKAAIKRMTGLIDSTLDLAKMETGTNDIEAHKEQINLHDLIREILERTSDLASKKNITIKTSWCEGEAEMNGDYKLLDHCFTNIISNAIKYSRDGTEVKIITKCNKEKIAIRVIDQGIGIPKDDLAKIGQKFFRAKNTLEVSGTGIGIYLTKYFIELHNGNIRIESELDVGTSFTVILPR